ncbi:MAG TPA: geranylgeranylglycerol-phosphate geranylgeranyltransferase [Thermoplasmata archaeon]|nr:geranylgeranylglycerol-phosphate geranylgeranyltransferase [Thermoplasmata archaeon]
MRAALRLVRAGNVLVSFVGTVVGALAARAIGVRLSPELWLLVLLAAASTGAVTAAGNVLNDVGDLEGDRRNHPDRPLVTGEVSVLGARRLTVGLFLAGVVLAVPVVLAEPLVGALLAVAIAALLAYELGGKARGLVGNLTVGLLTALVFLYGGAAVGRPWTVLPFAAMAFLATLSREVIKDMEDVAGDTGRSTVPKRYGMATAAALARGSVGGAIALSVVPFLWYLSLASAAGLAYAAVVAVADVVFVLSVLQLPARLHFEQTVSKGAMALALGAFLAVAFR